MKLSKNGFTLIELMVVVAIIGILSSIAIPSYKKYVFKSRQSEAKMKLASAKAGFISFMAEYNVLVTCLEEMGIDWGNGGYYGVGIYGDDTGVANSTARSLGAQCTQGVNGTYAASWFPTKYAKDCPALSAAGMFQIYSTDSKINFCVRGNPVSRPCTDNPGDTYTTVSGWDHWCLWNYSTSAHANGNPLPPSPLTIPVGAWEMQNTHLPPSM